MVYWLEMGKVRDESSCQTYWEERGRVTHDRRLMKTTRKRQKKFWGKNNNNISIRSGGVHPNKIHKAKEREQCDNAPMWLKRTKERTTKVEQKLNSTEKDFHVT